MTVLRIAQAQVNSTVGDIYGNLASIINLVAKAREQRCDIITFPELIISGYPPKDLLFRSDFLVNCYRALQELIPYTRDIIVIFGIPIIKCRQIYNAAAILGYGKFFGFYYKNKLANYGFFNEIRYFFSGGRGYLIIEIFRIRLLLTICNDIWVSKEDDILLKNIISDFNITIVINISSIPFYYGSVKQHYKMLINFARTSSVYIFYNNLIGGEDELVFDGGSVVINAEGEIVACARRFQEELLLFDFPLISGRYFSFLYSPYQIISFDVLLSSKIKKSFFYSSINLSFQEEILEALKLGLSDYVDKKGFKKVVVGVSGGVDSSLVACLAVEALGASNVVGVTMPSQFTSIETSNDVVQLANNLKIQLINIPIKFILDSYLASISNYLIFDIYGVEQENLQARIRSNLLMYLSNYFNWLVISTGNKSEIAVGYCTLYGDMAGGFALLKDVPKTLVYKISILVNYRAGYQLIPQSIIDRAPSAELNFNQKDENYLPPYIILDSILEAYLGQNLSVKEIIKLGFNSRLVHKIIDLVDLNEYKRRQAPVGVKITSTTFNCDLYYPVSNLSKIKY